MHDGQRLVQSNSIALFDPSARPELACPVCYGDLRLDGSGLTCAGCTLSYPIVDGIPVLIPERAEPSGS